ncbi:MAG: RagB/SusD family nutrient uptake outer membrane protein [Bacteroidales bacterium]
MKNQRIVKSVIIFFISGMVLSLPACEDFLDIPLEARLPVDYEKEPTAEEGFRYVSAVYAGLRSWGISVFPYIGMFEVTGDDADKGSTPDDAPSMIELNAFTHTPNNDLFLSFWNDHYRVIGNANFAINTLNELPFEDDAIRSSLVAEARFLRAFLYLRLNLAFGGIPLVETTLTAEEFAGIPRSSEDEIYDFIESDLLFAIDHLPVSYSMNEYGRATNGAAGALLARVYMYREKWAEVKEVTDEIIGSSTYALYPDFYKLFRVVGQNSSESVFELQLTSRDQGRYRCEYGFVQGPRNNFAKLQGWGFNVPSQKLIDFFDSRGDEIRKSATVLPRGSRTPAGDSISANCPNPYYNNKVYTELKYNTIDYALDHNIRYIRYAEVLLMNAEAAIYAGGDAATPLNMVRQRAGLDPIGAPDLQDVWDERRAELALEKHRFFDLVRTGRAAQVLGPLGFQTGRNEVFPIPQSQIDLSDGVLVQNPGY